MSAVTLLLLALSAAEAAPAVRTVAVLPPAPVAGVAPATLAKAAQTLEQELAAQGYAVVAPARVAAACKAQQVKLPCHEEPACLGRAAQAAGAPFAATLVLSPAGKSFTVKLVVIDAEGALVTNQLGFVPKPQPGPLAEALHKQVPRAAAALSKKIDERQARAAAASAPATPAAPAAATAPEPAVPAAQPAAAPQNPESPAELLAQAQKAYEAMEYEPAAALATRLLAIDGLDTETRLDAYVVQASCLAITADSVAAEAPFRLLLRARPDFGLPASTSPKILGVFQKVQAEERAISEQVKAVARRRLVENLKLLDEPPSSARGGRALPFAFRLRDPTSAVNAFEIPFRKQGEPAYSMLALKRDADGTWRGAIPAEWTASEKDYVLEYYVATRDEGGPLLTRGEAARPLQLAVSAGAIPRSRPVPRAVFWSGVALTGAAAIAAGSLALATRNAQNDYDSYARTGLTGPIDGALLHSKADDGRRLSHATLGTALGAGVLGAVTLLLLPFTQDAETTR